VSPAIGVENTRRISLPVGGMTCAACVAHVDEAIRALPGVREVSVNLMTRSASVVMDDVPPAGSPGVDDDGVREREGTGHTDGGDEAVERLVQAVTRAGYTAHAPADDDDVLLEQQRGDAALAHEARTRLIRAVVSLVGAMAAMVLSMPLMHGSRTDVFAHALMGVMDPPIRALVPGLYTIDHATLLVALLATTLPLLLWVVWPIAVRAFLAARVKNTDMNTLVVLGVGASVASSFLGEIAIDAALFITGFVLLGQAIEASARGRTSAALNALASLRVDTAHRELDDGSVVDVAMADLRMGDIALVRPGERLPGDGIVMAGSAGSVDESLLTGESRAVPKGASDAVIGGSVNGSQALRIQLTKLGKDSTLHNLLRLLREAQASRAPTQRVVDRVAAVFVPSMILLAALTFAFWFFYSGIDDAVRFAVAVLVVACPCAMGLAVPTAVVVATGKAASAGILIKGGDILERAAHLNLVVFDKTGTLTEGRPAVVDVGSFEADATVDDVVAIAAGLEKGSEHPLGLAIVAAAKARSVKARRAKDVVAVAGAGLRGTVDGVPVGIGNERLLAELGVDVAGVTDVVGAAIAAGSMPLIVVQGGRAIGVISLDDAVRDDASAAIAALRQSGLAVRMLTGDRRATADRVGKALGLSPSEIDAEVLPEDKLRVVQRLTASHAVAFVGDGVNDAAALAAATVGIGMGTGTDVAVAAADIALMRPRLVAIADVVRLSRRTRRIMLENLGWAFGYNLIMLPLAAGALSSFGVALSPILASVAMSLSSVTVVTNSLRLARFRMIP
jgi:Cu+-exporting ATPase